MLIPSHALGDAERQATQRLNVELDDHLKLTEDAFNLISEAVSQIPEQPVRGMSQCLKVSVSLIIRLSNDLRSASLLALLGYPTQAIGIVASLYESAVTIAYIGTEDRLAQEWIDHDDPTRTFVDVRTMTRLGLTKIGVPNAEQQASREYRVYRQLCMAKHGNPLYQRQHGYQLLVGDVVAFNGPDISDEAIRAAWFALEHAAGMVFIALVSFISNHVPAGGRPGLIDKLKTIGDARKLLEARAKARWGTEDPFPGKWRV